MIGGSRESLRLVLERADEDFVGLWEITIALRTAGVAEPLAAAQAIVRQAIDLGLLECVAGYPNPSLSNPMPLAQIGDAFSSAVYWDENRPFKGEKLWVYTTPAGEKWLTYPCKR